MVAHYLGAAKPAKETITDPSEQQFVPAQKLKPAEFDALVRSMGLPVTPESPNE